MAVRHGNSAIRETDLLYERARGNESDVGLGRNAEGTSGVWIERQEQAVALPEQEPLEIARSQIPTGQIPVAPSIVEERIDRSFGPHLVKGLDHAFRAAVRNEVLVGEGEPHLPKMRCRATSAAKTGRARWRRHRWGSKPSRQSHSNPMAWTMRGGNRTRPAS